MFFETSCSLTYSQTTGDITGQSLYNGNISNTTLAIGVPSPPNSFANNAVGYTYHYDQLNRLKKLRQYTGIAGTATWDRSYITLNDQENITYDGNGNILTYGRNGGDTTAQTIDSLTYNYNYTGGKLLNNQLQYIHDAVSSSGYDLDIRNQTDTANYLYDGIGNLIHDSGSIIRNIGWTVYNKPDTIIEPSGIISYAYNTANQRISKSFNGLTTWYVRDAQGNVLAVYDNTHGNINWREQHLYGSSRIGMWTPNINLADSNALDKWDTTGYRQFELDNHLGNVMTTINDVRNPYFRPSHIGPIPGPLQYFTANVLSSQDYYAFGMLMPDRQYTMTGDSSYRYGFNGQEKSDEIAGNGNHTTAEFWEYDTRVGRRWNIEPLISKYPYLSGYSVLGNNPVSGTDYDGEDVIFVNGYRMGGTGSADDRDPKFQLKLKKTYWDDVNKSFTNDVEKYFNDYTEHFVSGDHHYGSKASDRITEGKQAGIAMVKSGEIKVSKSNHIMTIVMHSQGNAEGVGIAEGIIEQAKRQGVENVTVNLVFLSVHQPNEISTEMKADLRKRGIQFTYANDDNYFLQPMAKQKGSEAGLKGVADANPTNKKHKNLKAKDEGGKAAHAATVDEPEAFDAIKKVDKEKKIYTIKPVSN